MKTKTCTLIKIFSKVKDPRINRTKLHKLIDIIVIAVCAVLCGANDWANIELFGKAKEAWFRKFLELPRTIPLDGYLPNLMQPNLRLVLWNGFNLYKGKARARLWPLMGNSYGDLMTDL